MSVVCFVFKGTGEIAQLANYLPPSVKTPVWSPETPTKAGYDDMHL